MSDDAQRRLVLPATVVLGCSALAIRPPGSFVAIALTAAVGAAGAALPFAGAGRKRAFPLTWIAVVGLGVAAFAAVRALAPWSPSAPLWWPAVAASVVAAIAEEAFFRRLLYGALARWGALVAILGAAAAFTAVHVPAYGLGVVPIDLAAGVLLGWQRWATGGWSAPAVTHVAANLLQMG